MKRWIWINDESNGWIKGCMVDSWQGNVQNLQLNVKKMAKRWDLGSNPGPPTHTMRASPLGYHVLFVSIIIICNIGKQRGLLS